MEKDKKKGTYPVTSSIKILLKTASKIVFMKATSHVPSKVPKIVSMKSGLDSVLQYRIRKDNCVLSIMTHLCLSVNIIRLKPANTSPALDD
jgi:hypothetical protein